MLDQPKIAHDLQCRMVSLRVAERTIPVAWKMLEIYNILLSSDPFYGTFVLISWCQKYLAVSPSLEINPTPKKRVKDKKRVKNRHHSQRHFYSGKKSRHTLKTQVVVDKKTKVVIWMAFSNGNRHDVKVFKESKTHIHPDR